MKKTTKTADAAYRESEAEVKDILQYLDIIIDENSTGKKNWAHAGTMAAAKEQLASLVASISGEPHEFRGYEIRSIGHDSERWYIPGIQEGGAESGSSKRAEAYTLAEAKKKINEHIRKSK